MNAQLMISHCKSILPPFFLTHLLHENLGFTPSLAQAAFNGVPSLTSIFFPAVEVNTVMCRELDLRPLLDATKALADPKIMAHTKTAIKESLDIILLCSLILFAVLSLARAWCLVLEDVGTSVRGCFFCFWLLVSFTP